MNNETIIEFGFPTIWRIMKISEGIIRLGVAASADNSPLDLHKCSDNTQP